MHTLSSLLEYVIYWMSLSAACCPLFTNRHRKDILCTFTKNKTNNIVQYKHLIGPKIWGLLNVWQQNTSSLYVQMYTDAE